MTIDVQFISAGRNATEKPDPKFPDGMTVNLAPHALARTCTRNLPYPAPHCGQYAIKCRSCGLTAIVTVAGRPDDPKIVTLPCKAN